jgi:hypothetical protein
MVKEYFLGKEILIHKRDAALMETKTKKET